MKKVILSLLAAASILSARAQLFGPEAWDAAVLGGILGGIIGHNHHGRGAEGAAIGIGSGLLLGSLVHEARRGEGYYSSDYVYVGPTVTPYANPYTAPGCVYAPVYVQARPSYAWDGAVIGGITGGVIAHNTRGRTGEGVAIGVGAGLVLGTVADAVSYHHEQHALAAGAARSPATSQPLAATATPAKPAASISSARPAVVHQIADAPRVPDAPSF